MQAPDVVNMPDGGGAVSQFLDSFLRGNRDDQPRKQEGSILRALNLMNNAYVESRLQYTGSTPSQLIVQHLNLSNSDLINTLYLAILSRNPSQAEMTAATAKLTGASNRSQA